MCDQSCFYQNDSQRDRMKKTHLGVLITAEWGAFFWAGSTNIPSKIMDLPLFSIGQGGIVALFRSNTPQKPCSNGTDNPATPKALVLLDWLGGGVFN